MSEKNLNQSTGYDKLEGGMRAANSVGAGQPLIRLIWPKWFQCWTGPESETWESLECLRAFVGEYYRSEPYQLSLIGALTTSVNKTELEILCNKIILHGSPGAAFQAAIRLVRLLDLESASDALERAVIEERCDEVETTQAALALETFGAVSVLVVDAMRFIVYNADNLSYLPVGALRFLVRNGGEEDIASAVHRLGQAIQSARSEEWTNHLPRDIAGVLSSLASRSVEVALLVDQVFRIESMTHCVMVMKELSHLSAKLGRPIPFLDIATQERFKVLTAIFEEVLRDPESFQCMRDALREAIDTIQTLDNATAAIAITAFARLGGDRSYIENACKSSEWTVRIGGYWGLFPDIDETTLSLFIEKEDDGDARAVLQYLLSLVTGSGGFAVDDFKRGREYRCIGTVLDYDYVIPVVQNSVSKLHREMKRDFAAELSGQELSMIRPDDGTTLVFADRWLGTDIGMWYVSLVSQGDAAARATAELIMSNQQDDYPLKNAIIALGALGGPATDVGETITRIFSYDDGPRWIDESRYRMVEPLVYSSDDDVVAATVASLKLSVLRRRPVLLQRLWYQDVDTYEELVQKLCQEAMPHTIFSGTVSALLTEELTHTESLALFSHSMPPASLWDTLVPQWRRSRRIPLFLEQMVLRSYLFGGEHRYLPRYAEVMGAPPELLISSFAKSRRRGLRTSAMRHIRDHLCVKELDVVLSLLSTEIRPEIVDDAIQAFHLMRTTYPDKTGGVIILANKYSDTDWNENEDWGAVFDRFNKLEFPEETRVAYRGRRLILEPVTGVPTSPGTLRLEEWQGLACYLSIEYQDESTGHILAVVSESMSAEIFGMLLNGKLAQPFVGRWT